MTSFFLRFRCRSRKTQRSVSAARDRQHRPNRGRTPETLLPSPGPSWCDLFRDPGWFANPTLRFPSPPTGGWHLIVVVLRSRRRHQGLRSRRSTCPASKTVGLLSQRSTVTRPLQEAAAAPATAIDLRDIETHRDLSRPWPIGPCTMGFIIQTLLVTKDIFAKPFPIANATQTIAKRQHQATCLT